MRGISPLYDDILVNCTIISDAHIDIKNVHGLLPMHFLKQSLKCSQNAFKPVDAYIVVGDTTSRGTKTNWKLTKKCFKKYNPSKYILLCVGNHDTRHDEGYGTAIANFYKYTREITGRELKKPYFSQVIKGFHFIFLGSDASSGCEAHIFHPLKTMGALN